MSTDVVLGGDATQDDWLVETSTQNDLRSKIRNYCLNFETRGMGLNKLCEISLEYLMESIEYSDVQGVLEQSDVSQRDVDCWLHNGYELNVNFFENVAYESSFLSEDAFNTLKSKLARWCEYLPEEKGIAIAKNLIGWKVYFFEENDFIWALQESVDTSSSTGDINFSVGKENAMALEALLKDNDIPYSTGS